MSPRHKKPRTCECNIRGKVFKPSGIRLYEIEKIVLYTDELESLKLCDADGLSQEEAGKRMGVSRGTVQRILANARQKVALALSRCNALVLEETICKEED